MLEKFAEEVAVEPREDEPLRAAGSCRDDVDVLGPETSVAKERVGISTGKQRKRTHPVNANMPGSGRRETSKMRKPSRGLF